MAQCLEALDNIHANGKVHNDIKPANIGLSKDVKNVKILDFGASRKVNETVNKSTKNLFT